MDPWVITSRLYNTLLSVPMNVPRRHKQADDFLKPTYVRPTVLMFPNQAIADHFRENHANTLRKSCMIVKNRRATKHVQDHVTTPMDVVLVPMPESATTTLDLLTTCPVATLDNEQLLCMTIVSYALYYYIEQYYINESNNLVLHGLVVNPILKMDDPKEMVLRYLDMMFAKSP